MHAYIHADIRQPQYITFNCIPFQYIADVYTCATPQRTTKSHRRINAGTLKNFMSILYVALLSPILGVAYMKLWCSVLSAFCQAHYRKGAHIDRKRKAILVPRGSDVAHFLVCPVSCRGINSMMPKEAVTLEQLRSSYQIAPKQALIVPNPWGFQGLRALTRKGSHQPYYNISYSIILYQIILYYTMLAIPKQGIPINPMRRVPHLESPCSRHRFMASRVSAFLGPPQPKLEF